MLSIHLSCKMPFILRGPLFFFCNGITFRCTGKKVILVLVFKQKLFNIKNVLKNLGKTNTSVLNSPLNLSSKNRIEHDSTAIDSQLRHHRTP
jgi:hypothetical protein